MSSMNISVAFLALLVACVIVVQFFSLIRDIINLLFSAARKSKANKELRAYYNNDLISSHLSRYNYFLKLSAQGKEKFLKRLSEFLYDKYFTGLNDLVVTDEMRILISAAATQLTFGLKKYSLPLFHTIRIFPDEFYAGIMEKHLKGGASPSGIIMLSWTDFVKGNADPADRINLGFHEMAHALLLEILYGEESNSELEARIIQWERAGSSEIAAMQEGKQSFLRSYGATNEHEFFAVSAEHFFEAPEEFKKRLPSIYAEMCSLLNQDPMNSRRDYQPEETFNFS